MAWRWSRLGPMPVGRGVVPVRQDEEEEEEEQEVQRTFLKQTQISQNLDRLPSPPQKTFSFLKSASERSVGPAASRETSPA